MEQLLIEIAKQHGPFGVMIASVIYFYVKSSKQDMSATNANTEAIRQLTSSTTKLEVQMENINKSLGKMDLIENDLNRAFSEIRALKNEEEGLDS